MYVLRGVCLYLNTQNTADFFLRSRLHFFARKFYSYQLNVCEPLFSCFSMHCHVSMTFNDNIFFTPIQIAKYFFDKSKAGIEIFLHRCCLSLFISFISNVKIVQAKIYSFLLLPENASTRFWCFN